MAYRDLAAALVRIEALEDENAQLRVRLAPRPRVDWLSVYVASVLMVAVFVVAIVGRWLIY